MTGRAYTVKELDDLRSVVESKWLFGSYYPWNDDVWRQGRTYDPTEKTKAVEELVRTHMLAGHTAEDLLNSETKA